MVAAAAEAGASKSAQFISREQLRNWKKTNKKTLKNPKTLANQVSDI